MSGPDRSSPPAQPMRFRGIPVTAFDYFRQLERHNEREWWHAHRALWDDGVHGPLRALAEELSPEFGPLDTTRPNRDLRFTKDPRPYQGFAAVTRTGPDHAALYLQVDATGLLIAAGFWKPRPEQLRRFRERVDSDAVVGLDRVLAASRRHRLPLGEPEALSGAPRGWHADHPRIDLLRRTRLTVDRHSAPAAWMDSRECLRRVRDAWRAAAAWNDWLDANVGGGSIERRAGDDL